MSDSDMTNGSHPVLENGSNALIPPPRCGHTHVTGCYRLSHLYPGLVTRMSEASPSFPPVLDSAHPQTLKLASVPKSPHQAPTAAVEVHEA